MLTLRNPITIAGLAATLLAAGAAANANSIVQSFNIPVQSPPNSQPISFQLFDSSLGALTSVTLELVVNGTAEVDLSNTTGSPQAFTNAFTSFGLNVSGPPAGSPPNPYISETLSANVASGVITGTTESFPGIPTHVDSGAVNIASTYWGSFEALGGGTSLTNLLFTSSNPSSGVTAPSGVGAGGSGTLGDSSSSLTLIYNYQGPTTPGTPEPGVWALFVASASVSIAGLRRRRAAK
jgi:hypothetical protein